MKEKVVLAYSGGLDTSYCVKYLSEELGLEVYTALANTGGFTEAELKTVEKKRKIPAANRKLAARKLKTF